jgi:hypothetical protein
MLRKKRKRKNILIPTNGKIKREDGKVLKPEGWTPPQLEQFTK